MKGKMGNCLVVLFW